MERVLGKGSAIISATMLLIGCGPATSAAVESPFAFRDIERMATMSAPSPADRSDLAFLYHAKLRAFEATYGEGVGPAKRAPAYLACRKAFDDVASFADGNAPRSSAESHGSELLRSLLACRKSAESWQHGEMATFGNDVRLMTSGSMIVLGYMLRQAQGSGAGPAILGQGVQLLHEDRGD
jgi:hypothetical protein